MTTSPLNGYPAPSGRSVQKELDHLDRHCRAFVGLSPFVVLSGASADGLPDVSPRGGAPGFVRVPDAHHLVLPDRPGNNRIDLLRKIEANPRVALLFLVPGIDETLRVYGDAGIATTVDGFDVDIDVSERGREPRSVLVVRVRVAFFHCAKALMRSALWDPDAAVDRSVFPTMGEVLRDQLNGTEEPESQHDMIARYTEVL